LFRYTLPLYLLFTSPNKRNLCIIIRLKQAATVLCPLVCFLPFYLLNPVLSNVDLYRSQPSPTAMRSFGTRPRAKLQRPCATTNSPFLLPEHVPSFSTQAHQASLAQLVERGTSNAEVTGSTPLGGSSLIAWSSKTMSNILLVGSILDGPLDFLLEGFIAW
jgi:hypothetical protein